MKSTLDVSKVRDPVLRARLCTPLPRILPERISCILERHGILDVCELLHWRRSELMEIPSINRKAIGQIYESLARLGFTRK